MKVALSNELVSLLQVHVLQTSNQEDPFPLAHVNWLDYKGLIVLLFVELRSEVIHLLGKDPSLREEVVLHWEYLMHSH